MAIENAAYAGTNIFQLFQSLNIAPQLISDIADLQFDRMQDDTTIEEFYAQTAGMRFSGYSTKALEHSPKLPEHRKLKKDGMEYYLLHFEDGTQIILYNKECRIDDIAYYPVAHILYPGKGRKRIDILSILPQPIPVLFTFANIGNHYMHMGADGSASFILISVARKEGETERDEWDPRGLPVSVLHEAGHALAMIGREICEERVRPRREACSDERHANAIQMNLIRMINRLCPNEHFFDADYAQMVNEYHMKSYDDLYKVLDKLLRDPYRQFKGKGYAYYFQPTITIEDYATSRRRRAWRRGLKIQKSRREVKIAGADEELADPCIVP